MKFEIMGTPVTAYKDGLIYLTSGVENEITQDSNAKILDSGNDFVIITSPSNTDYDRFFAKHLVNLKKVNHHCVVLWRLCKDNCITAGEFLYIHKLARDAILVTVKPALWLEVENL